MDQVKTLEIYKVLFKGLAKPHKSMVKKLIIELE